MIEFSLRKRLLGAEGQIHLAVAAKLRQGELLGLYGPSGAGKTSLLRILAGLTEVDKGYLKVSGEYWLDTDQRINLPPQDRHVGMLFQDYALFPHMSIEENLRFALPQERQIAHIEELIEAMGLKELRHQLPTQLSGGQQQRVALARTLLRRPSLLLLDEPFSALDSELSNQIRTYVYRYHRENQLTTILVSHRVEDMVSLADEVILLVDGEVKQQGKPADVFFPAQKISDRILGRVLRRTQFAGEYGLDILIEESAWHLIVDKATFFNISEGQLIWVTNGLAVEPYLRSN